MAANDRLAATNAYMGPGWSNNFNARRIVPVNQISWMRLDGRFTERYYAVRANPIHL
jgi:hypothetical protein